MIIYNIYPSFCVYVHVVGKGGGDNDTGVEACE